MSANIQLQAWIRWTSAPANCNERIVWSGAPAGIGSQLHSLADTLSAALSRGHARLDYSSLCFNAQSHWLQCPHGARQMFLAGGLNCTKASSCLSCYFSLPPPASLPCNKQSKVLRMSTNAADFNFLMRYPGPLNMSKFMSYAYIVDFLIRPNFEMQRLITLTAEQALPWWGSRPFIGLHVRTGDKKREAPVHTLSEYEAVLKRVAMTSGIRTVLLTGSLSDDEKRAYAKVLASSEHGITMSYIPSIAFSRFGCPGSIVLAFFVEVFLLRECSFFIGTQSSNVGRLVYELMAAKSHRLPLMHDMDNAFWFVAGDGIDMSNIFRKAYGHDMAAATSSGRSGKGHSTTHTSKPTLLRNTRSRALEEEIMSPLNASTSLAVLVHDS